MEDGWDGGYGQEVGDMNQGGMSDVNWGGGYGTFFEMGRGGKQKWGELYSYATIEYKLIYSFKFA